MIGRTLSQFKILRKLGSGGMGDVYLAEDIQLGREIALKILPPELAESEERRARFEREARAVAALNHPNIVTVHSVEEAEGVHFITMELVHGQTLTKLLPRNGFALDEFFDIAIPLADAVAAAHEKGITHRDLKPGNVMVSTERRVKVLDFGLAKLERGSASAEASQLSTIPHTAPSTIVGTLPYMSPEQAEGKRVDGRSDVFSLGVMLHEMLSGRRPFQGQTPAAVLSAIIKDTPRPIQDLRPDVPRPLARLVQRCLAKEASRRVQTVLDVRNEIEETKRELESGSLSTVPPRRVGLAPWAYLAGGALLGAGLLALAHGSSGRSEEVDPPPVARFAIQMEEDESLHAHNSASLTFSPDGTRIAYVANQGIERAIYLRPLDQLHSQRIAGSERASSPAFSPDGQWLAFEAGGKLWKVHVAGGDAEFIANLAFFAGVTWASEHTIVYTPAFTRGLFAVSAQGGEPRQLTTPVRNEAHIWPQALPGGETVLFTIWTGASWDQSSIGLLSLETGQWSVVAESGFYARYALGHLLYLRGDTLFAAPFDVPTGTLTGSPKAVIDGVLNDAFGGAGLFAASPSGSLVYARGTNHAPARNLVWVDRSGRSSIITSSPGAYGSGRLSPDGGRIALFEETATPSVWVRDIARDTSSRITFSPDDHTASWSPDGQRIAFESGRGEFHQVYVTAADGSGDVVQVTRGERDHYLCDWSPQGPLAYVEFHPETSADLWVVDPDGSVEARPFVRSPFYEFEAAFSPDGRWLAYVSDESGRFEVYVRSFPDSGRRWLVSRGGGEEPAWSRSGRELFYRSGGRMMSVALAEGPEFEASRPEVLFEGLFHYNSVPSRSYDVALDGRFIMAAEPDPKQTPRRLEVVLNWVQGLERVEP